MPFLNRIRLPFKVTRPQFPEERSVFRLANGTTKTQSVIVRKVFDGETDWLPEHWHERLKMALAHDNVNIEGDKYLGGVSQEGDYDIEWQEFLDYPLAKAKFKANVTPFNASNHNCMTCAEATQLDLVDDIISDAYGTPIALTEISQHTYNVIANDEICCYPAVITLEWYNSIYIDYAELVSPGMLYIELKDNLTSINNVHLATYRVACPNGSYDEAKVYGNVLGSIEGCLAPLNVQLTALTPFTAAVSWDDPSPLPDSYEWQLFEMQTPGTPINSGTSPTGGVFPSLTGLDDVTDYGFYVRSICDSGNSGWVEILFTTPANTASCGRFRVHFDDGTGISTNSADITYLDCNSEYQTVTVFNNRSRVICAQQTTPGNPIDIVNATTIDYEGLC
jgi:hypothetical protein